MGYGKMRATVCAFQRAFPFPLEKEREREREREREEVGKKNETATKEGEGKRKSRGTIPRASKDVMRENTTMREGEM